MIKLTNEEMANAIDALTIANEKGKLGYACARNLRKLRDCCKEYLDIKTTTLEKYGTPKELGGGRTNYEFKTKADRKAYEDEMDQYNNIEHDFDAYTIPFDLFVSGNLSSAQMSFLLWMVEEPEEEEKVENPAKAEPEKEEAEVVYPV